MMAAMNPIAHRELDQLAHDLALSESGKAERISAVVELARAAGAYTASIGRVYRALAAEAIPPMTVPAINLRGLTYDLARAVWQAAAETGAGPVIFELAPSESLAGRQSFEECAALVLAAALRERYRGPVFLQVDHLQVERNDPQNSPEFRSLCQQAMAAGVWQVDFDASSIASAGMSTGIEASAGQSHHAGNRLKPLVQGYAGSFWEQVACAQATAAAAAAHRGLSSDGDLVYGAEVGEIGGANTTVDDLREFMAAYHAAPGNPPPLGKISVNTGTTHGGLVDADGKPGPMPLDIPLLADLAVVARCEFGLPGVVQHATSTLSLAQLAQLPAAGVCEAHLATGIQNLVFDHPQFDADLRVRMRAELLDPQGEAEGRELDGNQEWTPAQRFYAGRWTAWGQFKRDLWELPEESRAAIRASLVAWCVPIFTALQIAGRAPLLAKLYRGEKEP